MSKGTIMQETINKIDTEEYYRVSEVLSLSPLLSKMRHYWLIDKIHSGELPAYNTSENPKWPRYLIKGSDLIDFLNKNNLIN